MSLRRFLGEIMTDLGFVTNGQLQNALKKQRSLMQNDWIPERIPPDKLIAQARMAARSDPGSLLGQILTEMGFVTRKQLETALIKQQEELDRNYRELDTEKLGIAVETGYAINSTLSIAGVLSLIMRHANRVTNSQASSLMLLDETTGELIFSVPTGAGADKLTDVRVPSGKGVAGWVAEHGQSVLVADAGSDPRFYQRIDELSGLETRSILCVPLKAKGKTIGVLEAINRVDGSSFTEEDARLLTIFSSQAAIAIENARLYGELKDRLEEERRLKRELTRAEKFRALGQMASGIAHDFNNILAAIVGYAELASFDLPDDHIACQSVDQIVKASHTAEDLVKQILAFSRKSEEKRVSVDVGSVAEDVLKLIRASMPSTIEIHQNLQPGCGSVLADPTQLHQVLMNLCTNASHAMQEAGGTLSVALDTVAVDSHEAGIHDDLKPGEYVRLSVSDTGHGMDAATLERIFDPYFTTKEMGLGTGMGLAVTHGIVESHQGAVTVFSEPESGSVFHVYLPRQEQDESETAGEGNTADDHSLQGKERILFVDDDRHLAELGKQMLERLGYNVETRFSAEDVLEALREDPAAYDLVVSDLTMPVMNGDELAKEIAAIKAGMPIILCVGFSERMPEEQARKLGIREFLLKPITMSDLSTTVRRALDAQAS